LSEEQKVSVTGGQMIEFVEELGQYVSMMLERGGFGLVETVKKVWAKVGLPEFFEWSHDNFVFGIDCR
jgi:hypothetical protein